MLRSHLLFTLNFSNNFIDELSLLVKELKSKPEEIIFRKNDKSDKLYFLLNGKVKLITSSNTKIDKPIILKSKK